MRGAWMMVAMLGLAAAPCLGVAATPAGGPFSEAIARADISKNTFIQACEGDALPVFTQVQVGTPFKRKVEPDQPATLVYPVHAHYTNLCEFDTSENKAEVDMRLSFYKDAFGVWTGIPWDSGEDQDWNTAGNGVRCRVQGIADVMRDKAGKELSRKPVKDPGFIGCTVMFRGGQ